MTVEQSVGVDKWPVYVCLCVCKQAQHIVIKSEEIYIGHMQTKFLKGTVCHFCTTSGTKWNCNLFICLMSDNILQHWFN